MADSHEITVTMTLREARVILRVLDEWGPYGILPKLTLPDRKELYRGESKIREAFNEGCRKLTGEPEVTE